ncbi:phage holin [Oceanobacillus kapialis]|uniref:phage holin n=1 Tax=Oceanobacillus kapialis TaxID=481353 RepID=UPI00384DAC94
MVKIDRGTVVRTIALAITWINVLLTHYNLQPLPVLEEQTIAYLLCFSVSVWAWFKNNYLTVTGERQKLVLEKYNLTK